MRSMKSLGSLILLFMPLALAMPACAQAPNNAAPAQNGNPHEEWNRDCPERQEIREERERIRAEHEELEAEKDRLHAQCMDSKGQERSECHERWEGLKARMESLHQRMKALHDQVESDPGCHHEHKDDHKKWPSRDGQPNVNMGTNTPQQPYVTPLPGTAQ